MKVKYKIPVIEYEEGEIELTEHEETLFKSSAKGEVLEEIADRLHMHTPGFMDNALDVGYAYIEEIKEKVTLDDVRGGDIGQEHNYS